ncbi:unnamed protein product [Symbiodinium sp. CCMP2592]|nr:unnamed protein product [Symbiodinium sp. CCMP2592]
MKGTPVAYLLGRQAVDRLWSFDLKSLQVVVETAPKGGYVESAQACQDACKSSDICTRFSYDSTAVPGHTGGACWLLDGNVTEVVNPLATSGPKACPAGSSSEPVKVMANVVNSVLAPTVDPTKGDVPATAPAVDTPTVAPAKVDVPTVAPVDTPTVAPVKVDVPTVAPVDTPTVPPVKVDAPTLAPADSATVAPVKVDVPTVAPVDTPTVAPIKVDMPTLPPVIIPTVAPAKAATAKASTGLAPTKDASDEDEPEIIVSAKEAFTNSAGEHAVGAVPGMVGQVALDPLTAHKKSHFSDLDVTTLTVLMLLAAVCVVANCYCFMTRGPIGRKRQARRAAAAADIEEAPLANPIATSSTVQMAPVTSQQVYYSGQPVYYQTPSAAVYTVPSAMTYQTVPQADQASVRLLASPR